MSIKVAERFGIAVSDDDRNGATPWLAAEWRILRRVSILGGDIQENVYQDSIFDKGILRL